RNALSIRRNFMQGKITAIGHRNRFHPVAAMGGQVFPCNCPTGFLSEASDAVCKFALVEIPTQRVGNALQGCRLLGKPPHGAWRGRCALRQKGLSEPGLVLQQGSLARPLSRDRRRQRKTSTRIMNRRLEQFRER